MTKLLSIVIKERPVAMKDLLKLLELPAEKLPRALYELGYTDYFVKLQCGRDGVTYECKTGSLADLASWLRDENKDRMQLRVAWRMIWDYKQNYPPHPTDYTLYRWIAESASAQDQIIAALFAGDKVNG